MYLHRHLESLPRKEIRIIHHQLSCYIHHQRRRRIRRIAIVVGSVGMPSHVRIISVAGVADVISHRGRYRLLWVERRRRSGMRLVVDGLCIAYVKIMKARHLLHLALLLVQLLHPLAMSLEHVRGHHSHPGGALGELVGDAELQRGGGD